MWKMKPFYVGSLKKMFSKYVGKRCAVTLLVIFLAYCVLIKMSLYFREDFVTWVYTKPRIVDDPLSQLKKVNVRRFQSNVEVEFPHNSDGPIRIPHIVHQIFNTPRIPKRYTNMVKSFHKKNPQWTYMFWTYDSGRNLIKEKHPYILKVYDGFGNSVKKADMLRYVVLYEYGGIYADLDVLNLRSLDNVTLTYACMLSAEPIEHVALLYKTPFILLNGIILCRPRHPFFERVLSNLVTANVTGEPIRTTGPLYITKQYMLYNELTVVDFWENDKKVDTNDHSPYFYKGKRRDTDDDNVFIPNSQYFIDSLDPGIVKRLKTFCKSPFLRYETELKQMACAEYLARMTVRKNKKYAYTDHIWDHLWGKTSRDFKKINYVHIEKLIPNAVMLYNSTHSLDPKISDVSAK
ncbi:hypothetical protein ACF0H5_021317 [Mactra antiquata]